LADGFYWIQIAPVDIPKLGIVFPTALGNVPLITFPLSLSMGWTSSLLLFCATTETIMDLANAALHHTSLPHPHWLERLAEVGETPKGKGGPGAQGAHPAKPLELVEVFFNDFIVVSQGTANRLMNIRQTLLHTIDQVFWTLSYANHLSWKEPTLTKKLAKGNGQWETRKTILGWDIDTVAGTMQLPEHRAQQLHELLELVPPEATCISERRWHHLLGKLRSMVLAIPGGRGLFSTL
jgi:hypothetical protein